MDKSIAELSLPRSQVHEDRFHVVVEYGRKFFTRPMDFRDDCVFPHGATLP